MSDVEKSAPAEEVAVEEKPEKALGEKAEAPEMKVEPTVPKEQEQQQQPDEAEPAHETENTTLPPQTPAGLSHLSTPSAPPPKLVPRDLPTETPAGSATPAPGIVHPDVSEFDPYATPVPPSGHPHPQDTPVPGPSTPPRRQQQPRTEPSDSSPAAAVATEPVFNFSGFLKDIKSKPADPIARYLKSFLTNFAKKPFTVNEQIKLIHDFLAFIGDKMSGCEPWKSQSPAEMDNAMEAMEKLVMNRLYNYTFTPQLVPSQPITTDDLERDAVFSQRVRLFSWVRERHLDVPESEAAQGFLGFAEQELLKINHYKAPRDKMICILNCCKVIFGLLRHANNGAEDTSADAFVPILIFVVLQANPDNLISNIEYINRFRTSSKLTGEAGYYLSSLAGAIQFIETMDSSALSNITQEEFEDAVSKAVAELPPSPSSSRRATLDQMHGSPSPFGGVAEGEEAARPLAMLGGAAGASSTRRFLERTGEVVSKPLSAIGKILEGMQGEGAGDSDAEGEREGTPSARTRTRAPAPAPRRRAPPPQQQQQRQRDETSTPTPGSPSQRLSQLGISDSGPPSGTTTPQREVPVPDFTFSPAHIQEGVEASQETYEQTRRANVQTLHQMFAQLEEEIVEAVLEGCGEDLGVAIDRLLEM